MMQSMVANEDICSCFSNQEFLTCIQKRKITYQLQTLRGNMEKFQDERKVREQQDILEVSINADTNVMKSADTHMNPICCTHNTSLVFFATEIEMKSSNFLHRSQRRKTNLEVSKKMIT